MATEIEIPVEERILQVLQHLGIEKAHFAARVDADWRGLAITHPEVIASLTLVLPLFVSQDVLARLSSRLNLFAAEQGIGTQAVEQALPGLAGANFVRLSRYTNMPWADVVLDRGRDLYEGIVQFLATIEEIPQMVASRAFESEGDVAGVSFKVLGSGPPLVLLPLQLAPSQWEPIIPELSQHYCTITLGGAYLGHAANLEARSKTGFATILENLIDGMELQPGQRVLDVGCGTGVFSRLLARRTGGANPAIGIDISPYLLREAINLTQRESLEQFNTYQEGSVEAIPFPDNSFDAAIAITVLEEVNADLAMSELVRVTKPGGKVVAVVRALDMPGWTNLPLRAELKSKVEATPFGGREPQGCADASLYHRFREAGLVQSIMSPQFSVMNTSNPIALGFYGTIILRNLSPEELEEWRDARAQAEAAGTFFIAQPFHCAVGIKPG